MIEKKKNILSFIHSGLYVAQCRRKTSRSILNAPNKITYHEVSLNLCYSSAAECYFSKDGNYS